MRLTAHLKQALQALKINGVIADHYYAWAHQADNILGVAPSWPVALLLTPQAWSLEIDTVTAREQGRFNVYFLTPQPELDFNADNNEVLIEQMTDAAVAFLGILKRSQVLRLQEIEIKATSLYDVNNRNLTGVLLNFEVKENQGRCL